MVSRFARSIIILGAGVPPIIFHFSVFNLQSSVTSPLRGEGVDQRETDEGSAFPIDIGLGEAGVYRGTRKCRVLFVKMIFRTSSPLIRLGIRRATFPPGKAF